jgi:hypothetical protein
MEADIFSQFLTEVSSSAISLTVTLCKIEIRYRPWPFAEKTRPISTNFIFVIIK